MGPHLIVRRVQALGRSELVLTVPTFWRQWSRQALPVDCRFMLKVVNKKNSESNLGFSVTGAAV